MKRKALFVAALVGLGSFANAQTTQVTNDKGFVVTPEAGDWAIGFNANPLFSYVGNAFNGSTGNTFNSQFLNYNSTKAIYGKMFKDENTAYRAQVRILAASGSQEVLTDTTSVGQSNPVYITDVVKQSGFGLVLGAGIEKRRGHNRLQGYYGGEFLITFGGTTANTKYEYSAELDTTNMNNGSAVNNRPLSMKAGSTFGVGVRGFIGAEYFFAPKISVAAEYGWGISWRTTSGSETVTEVYGVEDPSTPGATATTHQVTTMGGKSSGLNIDTDNVGGAIRLMFHF
jgi:hypothetical protein